MASRGRPPSGAKAKRHVIAVRATEDFRAKIDAAAANSGRSMSQEIEFRLERSFEEDRLREVAREVALQVLDEDRARVAKAVEDALSHLNVGTRLSMQLDS